MVVSDHHFVDGLLRLTEMLILSVQGPAAVPGGGGDSDREL